MARAAVSRRLGDRLRWKAARLTDRRVESHTARTLVFDVPGWPGHLAGQHVDVRLTAEDGYSTQRSYSLASAPDGESVELTVQRVDDGEVSPYLTDELAVGDVVELRGPVGGWFVWRPEQTEPILLVAGGSGLVPLMAMIRMRRAIGSRTPFRLVYSVRSPEYRLFVSELRRDDPGLDKTYLYSRSTPPQWPRPPGRFTASDLSGAGWPPDFEPTCYVCGSTGFVEKAAGLLVALGHHPGRIRTERFGPSR
ncbi:ferredoxin reductase [Streptomyces himalayensis]|uniref:Ferredoxin reductase n=1 Tax=Streptomyces himalayensis subsp. himalayensis TaxID=2756131 RepID=A0A7W0DIZ8_9ACTN|nr:ferredoxin reductase [Streptomyces himalayensis]MBA2945967.1 ferredoxin reductase [Streptomyces himalayensis subsp. himalayensis]